MQQEIKSLISQLNVLASDAVEGDELWAYEDIARAARDLADRKRIERDTEKPATAMMARFFAEQDLSKRAVLAGKLRYEVLTILNRLRYSQNDNELGEQEAFELDRLVTDYVHLYEMFLYCSDFNFILSTSVEYEHDFLEYQDQTSVQTLTKTTIPSFRFSKRNNDKLVNDLVNEGFLSDEDGKLFLDILYGRLKPYEENIRPVWNDSVNSILNFMVIGLRCSILNIRDWGASSSRKKSNNAIDGKAKPKKNPVVPCIQAAIKNNFFWENPNRKITNSISDDAKELDIVLRAYRTRVAEIRNRSMSFREAILEACNNEAQDIVDTEFSKLDSRIMKIYGDFLQSLN